MDGILFECFGPDNNVNPGNRVGSSTLKIIGREVFFSAFCAVRPLAAIVWQLSLPSYYGNKLSSIVSTNNLAHAAPQEITVLCLCGYGS